MTYRRVTRARARRPVSRAGLGDREGLPAGARRDPAGQATGMQRFRGEGTDFAHPAVGL